MNWTEIQGKRSIENRDPNKEGNEDSMKTIFTFIVGQKIFQNLRTADRSKRAADRSERSTNFTET